MRCFHNERRCSQETDRRERRELTNSSSHTRYCGVFAVGVGLARFGIAQGVAIYAAEGNGPVPYFLNFEMPLVAYLYVATLTVFAAVVVGVLPALRATGRR